MNFQRQELTLQCLIKAHSCRLVSSSKARDTGSGISVSEILKKGGWKSVHTFKTFYSRDIINSENVDFEFNYVSPILDSKCFENEIIFLNLIELMNSYATIYLNNYIGYIACIKCRYYRHSTCQLL